MRATLRGGNQVDVGFLHQLTAFRQPLQRPVHRLFLRGKDTDKRLVRQGNEIARGLPEIIRQAVFVIPGQALARVVVGKDDGQLRAEHRLGFQYVLEARDRIFRAVKILAVCPELYRGTGLFFRCRINNDKFCRRITIAKLLLVDIAVTAHRDNQML